ncbi:hypothetical protein FACS189426_15440 [Bacteroidia bacterium]|nr:hypothetical protein FACS189426_15440 [Bacteroidia bacterium]
MKIIRLSLLLLCLFSGSFLHAQISHGGTPFFPQSNLLRVSAGLPYIEMPAFDLDSVLREDQLNEGNMRGSYQFAHKFYTNLDLRRDAVLTVLPNGTTVRQIGIRSKGAYSINLLLQNFEIPEGGKLFVYNADHSYIIGSFDHRNNSPGKILPLQPVAGESIIVEYSESPNAVFKGNFTIAEVNHDYRDFLRTEPMVDNNTQFACMPDVLCSGANEATIRSTVLLIINGTALCTGSLINNTADNGKPYLLTAVHCLNASASFPQNWDYYDTKAGSIIAFFNYNRPVCDSRIKGTEEMSLAIAHPQVILEKNDVALLEFQDTPPDYYNAYYAGWNVEPNGGGLPHTNLHHPYAAVKKYGVTEASLALTSFYVFENNSHWKVSSWNTGSTHGGSSGSPLFDNNRLIVGGLSGGESVCNGNSPAGGADYFFALYKAWETGNPANQLKTYLDPANKNLKQYPGMDPHRTNPIVRFGNADYNYGDQLITSELSAPNAGFVFGNSNLQTLEFAEEFSLNHAVEVLGSYFLIPYMPYAYTSGVEVSIYSGALYPEVKLQSKRFSPKYLDYTTSSGFYEKDKNMNLVATESFVLFDEPVKVNNKFFISYKIDYSAAAFCVYNTRFGNDNHPNTAWIKDETSGWIPASASNSQPMKTALAIQALMRNSTENGLNETAPKEPLFYYDRSGRTLILKNLENESGWIEIYSVSGRLIEKFRFNPGQTAFVLSGKVKEGVGIVRVNGNNSSYAKKIIY